MRKYWDNCGSKFGAIVVMTAEKLWPYPVLYASCRIAHQIKTIKKGSVFKNVYLFICLNDNCNRFEKPEFYLFNLHLFSTSGSLNTTFITHWFSQPNKSFLFFNSSFPIKVNSNYDVISQHPFCNGLVLHDFTPPRCFIKY